MEKNTEASPNILLVGSGAVGAFYAGRLTQAGFRVASLSRSDYSIVKEKGVEIRSYEQDFSFQPDEVIQKAEEYSRKADYILVCLKVLPTIDQSEIIRAAVSPQTTIVLIQNGINIEKETAEAFPENEIISGIAFLAASRIEYGVVSHKGSGTLTLGTYPEGISENTQQLSELFSQAGVACRVVENIARERWRKMLWNASFNPISVLGGNADSQKMVNVPESEFLVRKVMGEVLSIANAAGSGLSEDLVDKIIASTRKMNAFKTSMLVDSEAGRAMEIDAILGNSIKVAEALNVETPYMRSLYGLLKLMVSE